MINHSDPPCKECGSYDDEHHGVECSHTSVERKAELYKMYYEMRKRSQQANAVSFKRVKEQVTFWQGKCAILKRENNALRGNLYRQKKRTGAVIGDAEVGTQTVVSSSESPDPVEWR